MRSVQAIAGTSRAGTCEKGMRIWGHGTRSLQARLEYVRVRIGCMRLQVRLEQVHVRLVCENLRSRHEIIAQTPRAGSCECRV